MATTLQQRLSRPTKTISAGNSIEVDATWLDTDGLPATPLSVRYQVFDALSGAAQSPLVTVPNPASSMEIRVPGNHLPVGSGVERYLIVQLQAEFETAADVHTELIEVLVKKVFTFSG
jgi:hypothetical protein